MRCAVRLQHRRADSRISVMHECLREKVNGEGSGSGELSVGLDASHGLWLRYLAL
jgi:hypothetical protein